MKRYISIISTLACAGMALMLTGCGDPVLDLSGDRESQKDSLMDVIKSYDTEDRIAFLSWYRGNDSQNKMIDGRKASEIIKIVRNEWKENYIRSSINLDLMKYSIEMIKFRKPSDLCGGKNKQISEYEQQRLDKIKQEADRFNNVEFSCSVNPAKEKSLLVTIKNSNKEAISSFSLAVDTNYLGETKVAGGIASGETATIEVSSWASEKVKEGYECRPQWYVFYNPADGSEYAVNVYNDLRDPYMINDLQDFKQYAESRQEFYYSKSGRSEACSAIGTDAVKLTDEALARIESLTGISVSDEDNKSTFGGN